MNQPKFQKLFGSGPLGAALSLGLFGLFAWTDKWVGHLPIGPDWLMQALGIVLICIGFALHFWSFIALRRWWVNDQLCTSGPFQYFRHPMYAAWISFVCPGIACYLNSWVYILWVLALQWLWRRLAKKEEWRMLEIFGVQYREYAAKTGRFWPKPNLFKHNTNSLTTTAKKSNDSP